MNKPSKSTAKYDAQLRVMELIKNTNSDTIIANATANDWETCFRLHDQSQDTTLIGITDEYGYYEVFVKKETPDFRVIEHILSEKFEYATV